MDIKGKHYLTTSTFIRECIDKGEDISYRPKAKKVTNNVIIYKINKENVNYRYPTFFVFTIS